MNFNSNYLVDQAEKGCAEAVFPKSYLSPPCDEDPAKTATNSVTDLKVYDEKKVYDVEAKITVVEDKVISTEKAESYPSPIVKKDATQKPKPKRKRASLWIRFNLWYNTYRFVFNIIQFQCTILIIPSQKILHIRRNSQCGRVITRRIEDLDIPLELPRSSHPRQSLRGYPCQE